MENKKKRLITKIIIGVSIGISMTAIFGYMIYRKSITKKEPKTSRTTFQTPIIEGRDNIQNSLETQPRHKHDPKVEADIKKVNKIIRRLARNKSLDIQLCLEDDIDFGVNGFSSIPYLKKHD